MIHSNFNDIPRNTFQVIASDPPWPFTSWSGKGKNRAPDAMVRQKGLAERHYATMPMHEIRALPVVNLAARDCVLFLWVVDCMLPQAIKIGTEWGFTFKTIGFTWAKSAKTVPWHIGLGYWTRGNTESCLLFTRGKPRRLSAAVRQLIVAPRREHSRKPEEFRERVEQLVPGPYLELFSREPRRGWDTWGDQAGQFPPRIEGCNDG